ncbi:hypothetical protein PGT21_021552 [Puccinia graminis f. sp. tritici]|uniref:Uncharacterized protein n=1 Tax=Puccinia graminis f. sp. tritici TaxID=56615 RepID=A0A5B0LPW6_PUCGR|nr:hypothetical protein PGT21_021552 [Puccinia graminis f. sp. tritici]
MRHRKKRSDLHKKTTTLAARRNLNVDALSSYRRLSNHLFFLYHRLSLLTCSPGFCQFVSIICHCLTSFISAFLFCLSLKTTLPVFWFYFQ